MAAKTHHRTTEVHPVVGEASGRFYPLRLGRGVDQAWPSSLPRPALAAAWLLDSQTGPEGLVDTRQFADRVGEVRGGLPGEVREQGDGGDDVPEGCEDFGQWGFGIL